MSEIERPTYETATRCPKCDHPGNVRIKEAAPRSANLKLGTQLHTVYCENRACKWFDTCWYVQVNSDGSIPLPKNHRGESKIYANFEGHDQAARDLVASLEAAELAQRTPGAELRGYGR